MSGKVQVFRNGVSSGEVPAEVDQRFLALRAFSIVAQHQTVVEVKNDSGKVKRVAKGSAQVTGKVLDKKGQPLREARVTLQGGGTPVLTQRERRLHARQPAVGNAGARSAQARLLGDRESPVELSAQRAGARRLSRWTTPFRCSR